MKKLLTLTAITLILSSGLFAQTTQEEYNYLTKGYKVQVIEQGGDIKKGYELVDVEKAYSGERTAYLKKFVKVTGATKKTVAHLIIYERLTLPTQYLCVPSFDSEDSIIQAYFKSLGESSSIERLQVIAFLLSKTIK